jgi:4'-phosphopantetheinyl transferase
MTASLWLLTGSASTLCSTLNLASQLSDAERQQVASFASVERRAQFTVGRVVLRKLLAAMLDLPASEIELQLEASGRPRLHPKHASTVSFSISHTRDVVCWAIHPTSSIGIDVEHLERARDATALAERFFHPREREYVAAAADEFERKCRFLQCWTLKEAWFKAFAGSRSLTLSELGFDFDESMHSVTPLQSTSTQQLRLWSTVSKEHILTLAWQGPSSEQVQCWRLSSHALEPETFRLSPVLEYPH